MRWTKYTLETTETAEEAVLALLWDLGIEGVSGLWLGRRCFYEEKQLALHESDAALWAIMTEAGTP